MLGAIIGDIVGSIYEWHNIKVKDFPFFSERCYFTDDTVMTIAVADALMTKAADNKQIGNKTISENELELEIITRLKAYGRKYPNSGYGGHFRMWLSSDEIAPYNSYGNGSAMRVSSASWLANSLEEAEKLAEETARVTHNHPEGIKGAKATASAIYLARLGKSKAEIKTYIEDTYDYDLSRTLDAIRPGYRFDVTCQGSVPEAIIAFLESHDFEDAIRNAISLGGDSDTLAAITGSIAEAAYGIPDEIKGEALKFLDEDLRNKYLEFEAIKEITHEQSQRQNRK